MKELIKYTSLLLMAILLMPSCRSKMGITKRHYFKGYYVSHTKAKNKENAVKRQPKQTDTYELAATPLLNTKVGETKYQINQQPKERATASALQKKGTTTYYENNKSYKSIKINTPAKELRKTISKIDAGDEERDALSLFWIIILVILILWLIGFIAGGFGLGALINILLVIALILLILWLLRIV